MCWIELKNCWYLVTEICGWYFKQCISKGNFTFLYDNDLPTAGKSWNYLWVDPKIRSLRRCHGISWKGFSPREFVDLMYQGKKTKCIFFGRWRKMWGRELLNPKALKIRHKSSFDIFHPGLEWSTLCEPHTQIQAQKCFAASKDKELGGFPS